MSRSARKAESFSPPDSGGDETLEAYLNPYGVGIDTHSRFIQICVLVRSEARIDRHEREFSTNWPDLIEAKRWILGHLQGLATERSLEFTIESTGCYHYPVLRAFEGHPHVVNPLLAAPGRRKTDRLDAKTLARHALSSLWPESFIAPDDCQVLRLILRAREDQKRTRVRAMNRANGLVLRFGHTFVALTGLKGGLCRSLLDDLAAGRFPQSAGVAPIALPPHVRWLLDLELHRADAAEQIVRGLESSAREYLKTLQVPVGDRLLPGHEAEKLLRTVPGVLEMCSLHWIAEVYDWRRFPCPKAAVAFAGCDPTLKISAGKVTQHVRRGGNKRLHQTLKFGAAALLRLRKEPIGQWGASLMGRTKKGAWKKTCSAVARRVALGLYHVQRTGQPFSYAGYKLYELHAFDDRPLEGLLPGRFVITLAKIGVQTTSQLYAKWKNGLAKEPGVGERCLEAVQKWVASLPRKTACSSVDTSSAGASEPSPDVTTRKSRSSASTSPLANESSLMKSGDPSKSLPSVKPSTFPSPSGPTGRHKGSATPSAPPSSAKNSDPMATPQGRRDLVKRFFKDSPTA